MTNFRAQTIRLPAILGGDFLAGGDFLGGGDLWGGEGAGVGEGGEKLIVGSTIHLGWKLK